MGKHHKVTDEELSVAVASSVSWFGVLRTLGIRLTGGSNTHYKARAEKLGIDSSHFTGQGHNAGKTFIRRSNESILVLRKTGRRQSSRLLVRALIATGRKHECAKCHQGPEWLGNKLTLDVDHINEDWLDDREENLRFLCPNCHSQFSRGLLVPRAVKQDKVKKVKAKIPRPTKIDWTVWDLAKLIDVDKMPMTQIGKMLGVSDNAVRKQYKKIKWGSGEAG